MRTSRWSASSSAGGRVCGVIVSSPRRGPMVSASRTTTQPRRRLPGRHQRCSCPARSARPAGTLMPNGPSRNVARLAVEQRAEHARRVEARDAQPVDDAVGRDQRAGVAVGEERVVGDRRERRRRRGALRLRRRGGPRSPSSSVGS